jgi:hypothetical protein
MEKKDSESKKSKVIHNLLAIHAIQIATVFKTSAFRMV